MKDKVQYPEKTRRVPRQCIVQWDLLFDLEMSARKIEGQLSQIAAECPTVTMKMALRNVRDSVAQLADKVSAATCIEPKHRRATRPSRRRRKGDA